MCRTHLYTDTERIHCACKPSPNALPIVHLNMVLSGRSTVEIRMRMSCR